MTSNALRNEQSIDIEYGDVNGTLQTRSSDPPLADDDDDQQVAELKDDDLGNFSDDESSDGSDSPLGQAVCDPCQDVIVAQSDCSNLATLLVSLSDALGYDQSSTTKLLSSAGNFTDIMRPFDKPALRLDTSIIASSEESSDVAMEYTNNMHDDLPILETIQQALQCPTCPGNQLSLPPDPPGATNDRTSALACLEPMSEIFAIDDSSHSKINQSTLPSTNQMQNDDSFDSDNVSPTSPTKKRKDNYAETSFLSTVVDDDSVSDWDGGSFVQENKKQRCGKWHCYLIGNSVLVIAIIAMSAIVAKSVLNSNSTVKAAVANPSSVPSNNPSVAPSYSPSYSQKPTNRPSEQPSWSVAPSTLPTVAPSTLPPTSLPSTLPSSSPTYGDLETTFYAIGDVPYNNLEKIQLRDRMLNLPQEGDFLIHVGDIRSGQDKVTPCQLEEYKEVRDILLQSDIPVFIIPGDNEWSDCSNPFEARYFWRMTFGNFDKNWNHPFQVFRHPLQPENFYFVHKRTLYFGLNLVNGRVLEAYAMELEDHADFVKSMIDEQVVGGDVTSVVLFGHAFPRNTHDTFFVPLRKYIQEKLGDKVPILYLNGDNHVFEFEQNYLGLSNFQRLQVDFGTINPPLKVSVSSSSRPSWNATDTFSHDRMLYG